MTQAASTKRASLLNPMQSMLSRMGLESEDFSEMAGPLGTTPKETIYTDGPLKLHHFLPQTESVYRVPLLIVTSLVNQPYILDLVPGQSMVEFLVKQGYDVYMIEWGRLRREHAVLTVEDHVLKRLPACVEQVLAHSGVDEVSLNGYCMGGLLSLLYLATHPKAPVKNLVCMATPVNGHGLTSLRAWLGEDFDEDALLEQFGNVPGEWIQNALRALRPFGKLSGNMSLLNNIDNPETVKSNLRMGKWDNDNLPFPGAAFRQMIRDFLRDNKLVTGEWIVGGQKISLGKIKTPLLHLLAQDDHITPYSSSSDLVKLAGSRDKTETIVKGGHVGLVAGRGAELRMWPALDAWLGQRSV
jgi:polyhydroxyalkanoate synthase subunit PhaC